MDNIHGKIRTNIMDHSLNLYNKSYGIINNKVVDKCMNYFNRNLGSRIIRMNMAFLDSIKKTMVNKGED